MGEVISLKERQNIRLAQFLYDLYDNQSQTPQVQDSDCPDQDLDSEADHAARLQELSMLLQNPVHGKGAGAEIDALLRQYAAKISSGEGHA